MSHPCPVTGCDVTDVPDERLTCRQDWARISRPLQRAVYDAWDHGRGRGTPQHQAAMDAAIRAAERQRGTAAHLSVDELWRRAGGGTDHYDRDRYLDLLREHSHLLKPGDDGYEQAPANLPCGWPHRDENGGM
jgi:hypothetical protein